MRKIWDHLIRKEYWPGEDRPRYYQGSAEVIGLEPGPDFVPPVMALSALDAQSKHVIALPMVHHNDDLGPVTQIVGDVNTTEKDLQELAERWPDTIYFMLWGYLDEGS